MTENVSVYPAPHVNTHTTPSHTGRPDRMSTEQYSRGWWPARLPIIQAFPKGKRIALLGNEVERILTFPMNTTPADYVELPDPLELFAVVDSENKVLALQPNFGSADTIRSHKQAEWADGDLESSIEYRVVHMKEVVK